MPTANRPAGPAKPTHEAQDAVKQREGLDELQRHARPDAEIDPEANARHAERDAHGKGVPKDRR